MRVLAVPIKSLERSKGRLAGTLSPAERAVLTMALLQDVLDACFGQPEWEVTVVSRDQAVLEVAARRGASPVAEAGGSLLEAVRQVEATTRGRSSELAVLLGDLPYLTAEELRRALAMPGEVVAAPALSDGGTNLLLRRPPSVIPARFGRSSFAKHRWAARRGGLKLVEARGPGLERDLDRPADLAALLASGHRGRARTACLEMGLAARLLERPVGA
jgi:2-phospho-L-lactate/phosphoenolpyruvate guanylyltransferase